MKPKRDEYGLMNESVQEGVACGLRRWYKHREHGPGELELSEMVDSITQFVMSSICEHWEFERDEQDEKCGCGCCME